MNQQSISNLLTIAVSLMGICSLTTPASAQLTSTKGLLTTTSSPSLTSTTNKTGSVLTSTTSNTNPLSIPTTSSATSSVTPTTSNVLSSVGNVQPTVSQIQQTTNSTIGSATTSQTNTLVTQPVQSTLPVSQTQQATNSTSGSTATSQTNTLVTQPVQSTLPILNNTTPILQNTTDATAVVKLTNDVTAQLKETTSTTVGTVAGASTDSQTNATVINPTQAQLPSLSNPTELIQKTGQVTLGVEINQNGVKVNAGADLKAALANLAKVDICLDASAALGSIDDGSLADCSQSENLKTVPEPTNIAALGIISTYILFLKGKLSKSGKVSVS